MASSSSSSSGRSYAYDVFLNFRGEDTRKIFVGHLYRALKHRGLEPFIDSEGLRKGNHLSDLLKAITDSKISIVVFSQNYVSSTWCLKELVQIMKCKAEQEQIVVSVFYEVDPSHVRKQEGSFAQAFSKHEGNKDLQWQEVQSALNEAASLSGWASTKYDDDAKLIDDIVDHVSKEWSRISSSKNIHLVGMDSHLSEMRQLLRLKTDDDDVLRVGIWGMGGIGKTTIAMEVYDEIHSQFDHRYFLPNVKEGFGNQVRMQEQLLSGIFKTQVQIHTLNDGYKRMKRLSGKRVLVVLDDVDNSNQIKILLGPEPPFGGGSRIIVTTRDSHILSGFERYEVKLLSARDAGKLFSQYAFKTNKPSGEYDHLSRRAVKYAQGLPLALTVLGSFLHNRSVSEWGFVLEKLKKTPDLDIQKVLKTSFDGLDRTLKEIFLDIACFFRGKDKDYVTKVLDSCGFSPGIGLEVLVERALVTISDNKLEMHDLLQEMGREIESTKEPGKQSRFWSSADVELVLTGNKVVEDVEGLMIDLPRTGEKHFNAEAFVSMRKLRLLIITYWDRYYPDDGKNHVNGDLNFLSDALTVLVWHRCPLKSLPSNFHLKKLVDLDMRSSHIKQLWKGTKLAKNLRSINLSGCRYLNETPDLTEATNLEELDLGYCTSLSKVHASIAGLTNLVFLSLKGCSKLKSLPSSFHLKSLKTLHLSGCSNLEILPEIWEDMNALSELILEDTAIKDSPPSIERLRGLKSLSMKSSQRLVRLSDSICNLEALSELILDGTAIKKLPLSIERLRRLESLSMQNCTSLVRLPDSFGNLAELKFLNLEGCSKLQNLPDNFGSLESLLELQVNRSGLEQLPVSILRLKLGRFFLNACKQMVAPLSSWPSSIEDCCTVVVHLDLSDCNLLELSDAISHFSSLKILTLSRNNNLKSLPTTMNRLDCLEQLELEGCKRLKSIPELSSSISYVNAHDCTALERVSTPKRTYDMGRCLHFLIAVCLYKLIFSEIL